MRFEISGMGKEGSSSGAFGKEKIDPVLGAAAFCDPWCGMRKALGAGARFRRPVQSTGAES
jgi:hypothetical protein